MFDFIFRRLKPGWVATLKTLIVYALVFLGLLTFMFYLSWWAQDGRLRSPWLVLLLVAAVLYGGMQIVGNWLLYLFAHRPCSLPPAPGDITVDVFVTAYREPYRLVERALSAACAIRGEHRTWLLDDGGDPALERLAQRLGAGYLTRSSHQDAKAGNLNAALLHTDGDILVIFDIDHVPQPDFLERSLGYFADPHMGFVQVMLTFRNGQESWVAQAAIETSLEYYNPTSLGANGVGAATLMGSNALIRRRALQSIGGYQPGLAEDLATSINLHAAGWKSAYVAEPLAPGLAPPSFAAWFTQQLKWARGVFELLLTAYPRLFLRLTWGQRLSYAVRMTKYWIGPVIAAHLFATISILIFGAGPVRAAFHQYLWYIAPLAVMDAVIRYVAFRFYRHNQAPGTSLLRAVALVYATWPIYLLAWSMAVLRLPLGFRPTPKNSGGRVHPIWLLPQFLALLLLLLGTVYTVVVRNHPLSLLLLFASAQAGLQLLFLTRWLYGRPPARRPQLIRPSRQPLAVVDVDAARLPERLNGLDGYRQAFCLVRLDGRPVGQALVNLQAGSVSAHDLRRAILAASELPFWERWLELRLSGESPERGAAQPALADLPSVAVAVCTRDRPQDLRRCLQGLARLPDLGQQILVVDSCSAGPETRQVVAEFPGVRYVREEFPGLDRARNRAFLETDSAILAFIDDDAVPDPGWLASLLAEFDDPRVLCVTGLTMPAELESEPQQWFEYYSTFGRGFRRRCFDKHSLHPLAAGHAGAGVNMAFRRVVWQLAGPFDEALDAGTPTQSGGDTEMFARILAAGYQIVYTPAALSWHHHRRDWRNLRRTVFGYGSGTYAFWTRKLLLEGEWGVFVQASGWLLRDQLPALLRALLRRPGSVPAELLALELLGCLNGPFAYLSSRRRWSARRRLGYRPYERTPGEPTYSQP